MSASVLPVTVQKFVEYFGDLGPRWGLPADACRLHALLYVFAKPITEQDLAKLLSIRKEILADQLKFLSDYEMIRESSPSAWCTSTDPMEMLVSGLNERRRRELGPALTTLQTCHSEAIVDDKIDGKMTNQIKKMLELAERLGALDTQLQRLPPSLVRGVLNISGRAARMFGPSGN